MRSRKTSLMEPWLLFRQSEIAGKRKRMLSILKSRGMAHSSEVQEFRLTDNGIQLDGCIQPDHRIGLDDVK